MQVEAHASLIRGVVPDLGSGVSGIPFLWLALCLFSDFSGAQFFLAYESEAIPCKSGLALLHFLLSPLPDTLCISLSMNPHWQGVVESERAIPLDAPGY